MTSTNDEREALIPRFYNPEVGALATVLFETFKRAEPEEDISKYPASYMATFADMAHAGLVHLASLPAPAPAAGEEHATLIAAGFDDYAARCALRTDADGGFCHAYFYSDGQWRFQTGGNELHQPDGKVLQCVLTKRLYAAPQAPATGGDAVDAVARAIYLAMHGDKGGRWECVEPRYQEQVWGAYAKAAITALANHSPDAGGVVEVDSLREALKRCRTIVQQHNHRQNEKVEDVVHIVNRVLGEPQS